MITVADIAEITARAFGLDVRDLRGPAQTYRASLARHVAITVSYEVLMRTQKEVAAYFKRSRSQCSHARQRVADEASLSPSLRTVLQRIRGEVHRVIEQERFDLEDDRLRHDMDIREALMAQLAKAHAQYLGCVETSILHVESQATKILRRAA